MRFLQGLFLILFQLCLRLYEIFVSRRISYEDEEIRAGDEWEVTLAFHTGRWTYPKKVVDLKNRLAPKIKVYEEDYYDASFDPNNSHPIFGWDHTTGEEYGRPPENWFEKRPETTYQGSTTASP